MAYADGPPPAHTGGFGEPTCTACHFDSPVDPPEGGLSVRLLPADPATSSPRIQVTLHAPGLSRGGFQLAVRHAHGPLRGSQAGELRALDGRVRVVADDSSGVQYAVQTEAGSAAAAGDTARWVVGWLPPASGSGRTLPDDGAGREAGAGATAAAAPAGVGVGGGILIHVAANAGNDDASAFGDRIYTACAQLTGAGEDGSARPCHD